MLYMVIETFRHGPRPVYARLKESGRMIPEGLRYVTSCVAADGARCWQVMECDDRAVLDAWIAKGSDLVDFEVIEAITSPEAAKKFG